MPPRHFRGRPRPRTAVALIVVAVLAVGSGIVLLHTERSAVPAPSAATGTVAAAPSGESALGGRSPGGSGAAADSFPNADNTGVPAGTALSPYTGPCTITEPGTVIDAKIVECSLAIQATDVQIRRSRISGRVESAEEQDYSFSLSDSEVDAGVYQGAAVGSTNLTVQRSEIRGAATSVYCWSRCEIRDSWLHGQRLAAGADWHLNGFLANDNGSEPGGRTAAVLSHNTVVCDAPPNAAGGGCSGYINLFGDFGPVTDVTVDRNYFPASPVASYCVYGGSTPSKPHGAEGIVVTGNVFARGKNRKCAAFGPVTDFRTDAPGNRWESNVWDDGTTVPPSS